MSTRFQTFNPSYENISNRITRLRHNSANNTTSSFSTKTHSISKNINPFTVETPAQSKRKVSPTPALLTEDKYLESGKFTGRVTKNVGLKKYNQRQLKEVMQCKITAPLLRSSQGTENYRFKTEVTPKRLIVTNTNSKMMKWERSDQIKMNQEQAQACKSLELQKQLIPGKLYTRNYLASLLRQ